LSGSATIRPEHRKLHPKDLQKLPKLAAGIDFAEFMVYTALHSERTAFRYCRIGWVEANPS
jgi:hypothetical protein